MVKYLFVPTFCRLHAHKTSLGEETYGSSYFSKVSTSGHLRETGKASFCICWFLFASSSGKSLCQCGMFRSDIFWSPTVGLREGMGLRWATIGWEGAGESCGLEIV